MFKEEDHPRDNKGKFTNKFNRITSKTIKTNYDSISKDHQEKLEKIIQNMDELKETETDSITFKEMFDKGHYIAGRITLKDNNHIELEFDPFIASDEMEEYPYNSFEAVIYHEFGHIFVEEVIKKDKEFSIRAFNYAVKNYYLIRNQMGEYAVKDQREFLTECFAYHYALPNYSPIAETWYNLLIKRWKELQ